MLVAVNCIFFGYFYNVCGSFSMILWSCRQKIGFHATRDMNICHIAMYYTPLERQFNKLSKYVFVLLIDAALEL